MDSSTRTITAVPDGHYFVLFQMYLAEIPILGEVFPKLPSELFGTDV